MADNDMLERQREIRRRKILDNAELRLQKITGRLKNSTSAPDTSLAEVASLTGCPSSQNPDSNLQKTVFDSLGTSLNDSQNSAFSRTYSDGVHYRIRTANETKLSSEEHVSNSSSVKDSNDYPESPSVNGTVRPSSSDVYTFPKKVSDAETRSSEVYAFPKKVSDAETRSYGRSRADNSSEVYAFPKKVSDAETRSYGRSRADNRRNSTCAQIMRESLQLSSWKSTTFRPWIVIAIAGFFRICFLYSNLIFMPENLILPFLLIETLLYVWTKFETQQISSRQTTVVSLLPGLLMLCGVPPSFVNAFTEVYSSFCNIGQDFAVYLFSFVLMHTLCENFTTE